jgi:hypothetical protein
MMVTLLEPLYEEVVWLELSSSSEWLDPLLLQPTGDASWRLLLLLLLEPLRTGEASCFSFFSLLELESECLPKRASAVPEVRNRPVASDAHTRCLRVDTGDSSWEEEGQREVT